MAPDDEDDEDLYDDEFDFVDDDEDDDEEVAEEESELEAEAADSEIDDEPAVREALARRDAFADGRDDRQRDEPADADEEKRDEFGRPQPEANYVVHVYEYRQFKRTIDRPFTPEDAEAFASEFNRTSKPYGRFALAGKNDAKPRKSLD